MSNVEKNRISRYYTGLDLLRFENICYFELIKQIVKVFSLKKRPIVYGNAEGLNAYLSVGLQLDIAVFLYESIKYMGLIVPQTVESLISTPEFKILEKVRNNIHTFFKKGNFASKADEIIENNLEKYGLKKHDIFFALRNDISLVFEIVDHKRQLLGSDYFIQHCLFECSGQQWNDENYKTFAEYLSSSIKAFAETVDETVYRLKPLLVNEVQPQIELFDYKSADLFVESMLSDATSFRLMLMLFQISYGIILVEKVLAHTSYYSDDLWFCFFTKLLAIKYDESVDNLSSLLKYASLDDRTRLTCYLSNFNFNINRLSTRDFARNLRNTIHYQDIQYNPSLISGKTTREYILAIYLSNSNVKTIDEFKNKALKMFNEMKILQTIIRHIMNVDKNYRI